MPFGYSTYPKTREQYLEDLGEVLVDSKTLVFLDTNILSYLFKLLSAARVEFYDWADTLISEDRLKIPSWALSEYLAKFKGNKLNEYTAKSNEPEEIKRKLENLHAVASLIADEGLLKNIQFNGGRGDFLAAFTKSINELSKYTAIFKQQFDAATIHDEISNRLYGAVLGSDVVNICVRAGMEGDVRASHRIPPGFKDAGKGENKYGDLIIWLEILEFSAKVKDKINNVVFISNDEKPDWVYAPVKRQGAVKGGVKAIPNVNPKILLPDPRLVSEFCTSHGTRNLSIITLPVFVEALSRVGVSGIPNLASAIQVEAVAQPAGEALGHNANLDNEAQTVEEFDSVTEVNQDVASTENVDTAVEDAANECNVGVADENTPVNDDNSNLDDSLDSVVPGVAVGDEAELDESVASILSSEVIDVVEASESGNQTVTSSVVVYPADALRDSAYEIHEGSKIDKIISCIKVHNWYVQNPAIVEIKTIRNEQFDDGAWFVLGRNIYQAACGNALKAMEFINNLDIELSRHEEKAANHILAGIIFEVYFNGKGELRISPKSEKIDEPFALVAQERYLMAKTFLQNALKPYEECFLILPGNLTPVELIVIASEAEALGENLILTSVTIGGIELVKDVPSTDVAIGSPFWLLSVHKVWTLNRLMAVISENWVIPMSQITKVLPGFVSKDSKLGVQDGKVLDSSNFKLTEYLS